MSKQPTAPEAAGKPAGKSGSGLVNKVTILGLVLAVIIGECVAAYFFLGSGTPASAADPAVEEEAEGGHGEAKEDGGHGGHGESKHGEEKDKHGKSDSHGGGHGGHDAKKPAAAAHGEVHSDHREVDLGEYSIMATDPASSTMLLVDFHIFGTVANVDMASFEALYEENRHRIRHQVIIVVRGAEMADLTDASLGLIRRQIREKTNQLLGKPLVQEIIFSKFSFIEQ